MKFPFYMLIVLFLTSCSKSIKVYQYEDLNYGTQEIEFSLSKFKSNDAKLITLKKNRKYISEFKRIKKYVLKENVDEFLSNLIYNNAFVLNKDTLYVTTLYSEDTEKRRYMKIWKYKGKTYPCISKIFNYSLVN